MKLSEKIYTCRKKAGLSQEALAEKLGVSRQAVSKWETDEAIPELSKIPMMAKIFGVTADFLLSDEENFEEAPKQHEKIPKNEPPKTFTPPTPSAIENLFQRFGWLIGVYVAIVGGILALLGALILFVSTQRIEIDTNQRNEVFENLEAPGGETINISQYIVEPKT